MDSVDQDQTAQNMQSGNQDFLFLPQKLLMLSTVRKGLTLYYKIPTFNDPGKEAFLNIEGKGENAGYQHFLLFPRFLPFEN